MSDYVSRSSAVLFMDGIFASQHDGVLIKVLIQMERHNSIAFILERQETTLLLAQCSIELQVLLNKQKRKKIQSTSLTVRVHDSQFVFSAL